MAFGSCRQCEAWQVRYDALLEKYHALRLSGAVPMTQARITPAQAPPEERAINRAHDEFVEEAAKHIAQATGVPIEKARQEAERFRQEIDHPIDMNF